MNIALLGYGKMGKVIERIALERGHTIVFKSGRNTSTIDLSNADVAIDFSIPDAAVNNISTCFNNNVPVISGTTGWLESYDQVVDLCNKTDGAFIYGSNFSLGVNVFFELNNYLARMMNNLKQYNVNIEEIHHTQKLDAPSGTAISLAEGIINNSDKTSWKMDESTTSNEIPVIAKRIPDVPGTHTIDYTSEVDSIKIEHIAHNRNGFALGAVIAAEWIQYKKGVFTMKDVLGL
ncbi:MAG: 4-hydroxy-tetrahydrodipicolinate reductase [Flavobacteriaceae bacterium]|nr:4-hydroxy-tetrahydrodipicolinate reductase [Flavobacteriaceae bacterium]